MRIIKPSQVCELWTSWWSGLLRITLNASIHTGKMEFVASLTAWGCCSFTIYSVLTHCRNTATDLERVMGVCWTKRIKSTERLQNNYKKGHTSDDPSILRRAGRSCRRTGKIWSSDKSDLINSWNTCIAPCTDAIEDDDKREINELSNSGYSSGQSQSAIIDKAWA